MAENCAFILDNEPDSKAILWAHNVHIAKTKSLNQPLIPMGNYLKSNLNERYYALGFGFNSGQFTAQLNNKREIFPITVKEAKKGSSDQRFSECNSPLFFLNFNQPTKTSMIPNWLNQPTSSRNISATYYKKGSYRSHILTDSYDGIIFIRETTASHLLDFNLMR